MYANLQMYITFANVYKICRIHQKFANVSKTSNDMENLQNISKKLQMYLNVAMNMSIV